MVKISESLNGALTALQTLLARAIEAKLTLEEFVDLRRHLDNRAEIVDIILDDIETAVEHTPGHWFSASPNLRKWTNTYEYLVLRCDDVVLRARNLEEDLMRYRRQLIEAPDLSTEMLDRELARLTQSTDHWHIP